MEKSAKVKNSMQWMLYSAGSLSVGGRQLIDCLIDMWCNVL